ncbi:MAG TPA: SEC-C domain-containing protein [Candidatus Polarisedimenticolaceae bacterium]|nr:SEC-C domain-containing protein [Candidatus Polarisedimenticolaceae bacterium]
MGYHLCKPGEERGALGRALAEAMRHPLVGPARRPSRIRVPDANLAAEVETVVGDLIPVTIAATPELNELVDSMFESFTRSPGFEIDGDGGSEEESYFENGRVSAAAVADLFAAARLLHHVAPWKVASDQQALRLDIPELQVEGACVSIIGALGQNLGLLIFPSLSGFDAFLRAASKHPPRSRRIDLGTSWLSFTLVPGSQLPTPMRREVAAHGWPVADETSYPQVEHREADGLLRPLTERDVRIASACATSLSAFFVTNRRTFESKDGEPICQSYTDDEGRLVRFTFPYEAFPLFDIAPDPQPASVGPRRAALRRNEPCHCGSGRKYKQCHLATDRLTK